MEAKLWRAVYRHVLSLAHHRRPREQFDDRMIVLVMLRAAAFGQPICWACRAGNWPSDFDRPLPSDSTVSRRLRTLGVQQLWERALAAVSDLLEGSAGAPLVKAIDSKPLTVGAYSKDRHAKRGHIAAGQKARGYRLHALCHGRNVRQFVIGSMDDHDSKAAPTLLGRLEGGGYVRVRGGRQRVRHQRPARACRSGQSPAGEPAPPVQPGRARPQAQLCAASAIAGHHGLAADASRGSRRLWPEPLHLPRGCRELLWSCFGELSYLGLNYLPAWIRGPKCVAWWTAAKILVHLCRRAQKKGLMR